MLNGDFFKIFLPICIETVFFLPVAVELLHNALNTYIETTLEYFVKFITSLNYLLMVCSVFYRYFCVNFVLYNRLIWYSTLRAYWLSISLWRQFCKINLKYTCTKTLERSCFSSGQILITFHSNKVLYIFVFLLYNLVARQHNEVFFVNYIVK